MAQNNSLNHHSEQFEIGPDSTGESNLTSVVLVTHLDGNTPTGIKVLNDTNGTDSAAITNYQTDSGNVQGSIGTYSPSYITTPNLSGRLAISCAGASSNGIALKYSSSENILFVLDSTIVFNMSGAGELTLPLQPSCCAFLSATQSNVTGNGTEYTIPFDSEVWDQGSDFNTTTHTFTAPKTGKYRVASTTGISGTASGTTEVDIRFLSSNRTWISETINPANIGTPSNQARFNVSNLIDMDANDTLTIAVKGFNSGSDDLSVLGAANVYTSVTISLEH